MLNQQFLRRSNEVIANIHDNDVMPGKLLKSHTYYTELYCDQRRYRILVDQKLVQHSELTFTQLRSI